MSFLKHAKTASREGRAEDAAWLREKAADRWAQRKVVPDVPRADDVAAMLDRLEGVGSDVWIDGMRLLTLLRVSEKGHPVDPDVVMVFVRRLEDFL